MSLALADTRRLLAETRMSVQLLSLLTIIIFNYSINYETINRKKLSSMFNFVFIQSVAYIEDPILAFNAEGEINNLQWCKSHEVG